MSTVDEVVPLVSCVRCAVAADHPRAELPRVCPACGRDRSAV